MIGRIVIGTEETPSDSIANDHFPIYFESIFILVKIT